MVWLIRPWTLVGRRLTTALRCPRRHVTSVLVMAVMATSMFAFLNLVTTVDNVPGFTVNYGPGLSMFTFMNLVTTVDNVPAEPKYFLTGSVTPKHPTPTAAFQNATSQKQQHDRSVADTKYGDVYNRTIGTVLDIAKLGTSGRVLSETRIVVVLAYQRTGSTLVGKLLEQIPGTFYAFEPIGAIVEAFRYASEAGTKLTYIDGSIRNYSHTDAIDVIDTEILNWLTCRLDLQSVQTLTHDYYLFSKFMKLFNSCTKPFIRIQPKPKPKAGQKPQSVFKQPTLTDTNRINACAKQTIQSCTDAPLIAIKFIRLTMRRLVHFLPVFPNMKIIHLLRDPRGMYNSRLNLDPLHVCPDPFDQCVEQDCAQITQDLVSSRAIMEKHPDRVKILQYEDMAERPIETAQDVYKFIGAEFTQNVRHFVKQSTSSAKDNCVFCTDRKNSSATSSKWRHEMLKRKKFASIQYIQTKCEHSNRVLGYLPFDSESEMSDSRVPSRKHFNVSQKLLEDEHFQGNS